jgi:hypothetical protein
MSKEIPWKIYELATGRIKEMNQRVSYLVDLLTVRNPTKVPVKVIIGDYWLAEDSRKIKSFWLGYMGEVPVEIIEGRGIIIIKGKYE